MVKPLRFCNPVQKNGEAIKDPSAHLTCYMMSLFTSFDRRANQLSVTNQFGDQQLDFRSRSSELCIPTENLTALERSASGSAPLALQPTEIDDFAFSRAKTTLRTPRFERRQVNLVDQWIDADVEVIRPARFGVPTCTICPPERLNEVILDPDTYLTCYTIRKAPRFDKRDVDIDNDFGEQRLTVRKPRLLCVPTRKADN